MYKQVVECVVVQEKFGALADLDELGEDSFDIEVGEHFLKRLG